MPPASRSLLSAVERTEVPEDRLTEALACVAQVHKRFAADLLAEAGLAVPAGLRVEVTTQRRTPSGRRVDLELAGYDGLDVRRVLLWVEVKAGAGWQPDQLPDYAAEVRDPVLGEPHGRVLAIIPPDALPLVDLEPGPARWETRTWAQVATLADRLGRAWTAGRWRTEAMRPSAPAQWRYLTELIGRLEEKGYARVEPLTAVDVVAAARAPALTKTLDDLVKTVSRRLDVVEDLALKRKPSKTGRWGTFRTFDSLTERWFNDRARFGNAYPELLYRYADDWTPEPRGLPAFCAGVTFNQLASQTRELLGNEAWRRSLPDGVTVGGTGSLRRVVRTRYLSELVVRGATLDEQTDDLTAWASNALHDIFTLQPPGREFSKS